MINILLIIIFILVQYFTIKWEIKSNKDLFYALYRDDIIYYLDLEFKKMNRQEERLFKKQLERFYKNFSRFNIYQLEKIRDLIIDIIERKKKNEKVK